MAIQTNHVLPPLPNDPFPLVQPGGTAGLDHVYALWTEADLTLGAHVAALGMWTKDVSAVAPRSRLDWCVASLEEIQDCLSQLSAVIMDAQAPGLVRVGSPLVRYVTETYVWMGDLMEDVLALVQELRGTEGGAARKGGRSTEEESAYVREFLDPLYEEILGLRSEIEGDLVLRQALPLVASLRATVVALDGALRSSDGGAVHPA
jgi:hypothetical protein